ncbi:MAG: penicillin-binding transpeptidase domain-containing protein [Alcaligenaceae bacterium]|nr:penicillin-binding transpeptidase domain-containing protein [Alcaligenaceae bacterium]
MLDNKTGEWLAYVGSADFFNPERFGQIDMLTAIRSPGSALKPFITLFAFDWFNYAPETTIDDTPIMSVYQPSNYDGLFQGRISLATALRNSRNVPAVRLLKVIQPAYFASALQKNNLRLFLPKGAKPNLAIALGGVGVQGDELTKLYSKLANCTFHSNKELANTSACKNITAILNTSQNTNGPVFFGKEPVAFKTGTSYGWRDRWLFAYTKDYTITLWNGRADHEFSENKASADVLIPLLRQVVGLLPNPPKTAPQLSVVSRRNQDLPQQLRHVDTKENAQPSTPQKNIILDTTQKDLNPFYIATPLNNSIIEYQENLNFVVRIHGGTPPYMYLVNDQIMEQTHNTSLMIKHPSTGRYEVLVIDANGLSTATQFTIKTPKTQNKTSTPIEWKN